MSPSLYLTVVPLILRNGQPMFDRRSFCSPFTLHPRMAAYTCSSTHAHGTAGTCVRSTGRGAVLISSPPCGFSLTDIKRFVRRPAPVVLGVPGLAEIREEIDHIGLATLNGVAFSSDGVTCVLPPPLRVFTRLQLTPRQHPPPPFLSPPPPQPHPP